MLAGNTADPMQRLGFLALCGLLYLGFGRLTDFFGPYLHLPFILSIICLVMAAFSQSLFAVFRSPIGVFLALLTVWLVVCIPFSVWRGGSWETVVDQWFKSFALFVITGALLRTYEHCAQVVKVFAFSFLTTALLAFPYGVTMEERFGLSQGLYAGANELATAMVQGVIFWWAMMHKSTTHLALRILCAVPLLPTFYILAKTGSRAGLLVIIILSLFVFAYYTIQGRVVYAILLLVGISASLFVLPENTKRRLLTVFSKEVEVDTSEEAARLQQAQGSSTQRAHLLRTSIALTFEHPLFGVGPGQFAVAENREATGSGLARGSWLGTHNTYTQISSESGFPGFLFFTGSMIFCWRELRLAERILRASSEPDRQHMLLIAFTFRLALLSYIFFFCFEHIGYDPFYPALAGVISAFSRIARESLNSAAPAPAGAR